MPPLPLDAIGAAAVVNDGTSETVFGELVGDLVNARARVEAMLEHFGQTGAIAALYRHIGADLEVTPVQARAALATVGRTPICACWRRPGPAAVPANKIVAPA